MRRFWRSPAIALLLLAPVFGELLPGWQSPLVFFNPLTLHWWIPLYGIAALCIRELAVRWKGGMPAVLLLGAAYGVIAEALVVRTWFDAPPDDPFQRYGRAVEVNWGVILPFTIFHAVFSIAIPICLAQMLAGDRRQSAWLGNKTLATLLAVWALVWLGSTAVDQVLEWLFAMHLVGLLVVAARYLAPRFVPSPQSRSSELASAVRFVGAGAALCAANFLIGWWLFAWMEWPVLAQAAFFVIWAAGGIRWVRHLGSGSFATNPRLQQALILGAVWALLAQAAFIGLMGALDSLLFSSFVAIALGWWWIRSNHGVNRSTSPRHRTMLEGMT